MKGEREIKDGYRILPLEFSERGFNYKQVWREKDVAIYEQLKGGYRVSYEVIKIKRHNGYIIGGNEVQASEVYPSASEWGIFGFSVVTLERAKQIANGL